ncbi:MAG: hypothetical protein KAS05_01185, partial [Candidatus Omnitrophica bacterium]|nr:hypothetical protein [Candidatus Omnitrophota bacterium]
MSFPLIVFSASDDHLVEIGKIFLEKGYTYAAKTEFEDALTVNPSNRKAKMYLTQIRDEEVRGALDTLEGFSKKAEYESIPVDNDYPVLSEDLQCFEEDEPLGKKDKAKEDSDFTLKGEYQVSFGIEGEDFIWKRANADLNEENWRILSDQAYNRRENTFDPAIYSYIKFEIDRSQEEGWGFHSNFDFGPWSFIGKSEETVVANNGDTFDVEYKYWSNTGYTVNERIYSNFLGDALNLPEMKVIDNKISSTTITSRNGNILTIPELKIDDLEVWPVRELWFDYNSDELTLRVFPVGMDNLAYSSDDPLSLTNNHTYWEESQWLINWQPGHLNAELATPDFQKGWWDDATAYITRDSTGQRLTTLRGFSLSLNSERSMLDLTAASPKELWQDYDDFNTFQSAMRGKYFWKDDLTLGFVYGSKFGSDESAIDVFNHFFGFDFNLGLGLHTQLFLQAATSVTEQDKRSAYETKNRGNSFKVSLVNSSSENFGKNYFSILPETRETFYKLRLDLTHMDEGFESSLSSFRETRDDTFWSRHLSFRTPFDYHFSSFNDSTLSWEDIEPFRIGDGIDYGRDTINFRFEAENLLEQNLDALFDIRNVHDVNGEYIENVSRLEIVYQPVDKLTTKVLGIYHDLPKTNAGVDPFIIDPETGDFYQNTSIEDGKDPTLKTISLGAKYDFFDWLNSNFIWEHTNDSTLAYDNFGRGLLSWASFATYTEGEQMFRDDVYGLNNPGAFPAPPYSYFDIFKVGIGLKPKDNLEIYLDYARNEYEWSQIIDDNTNHIGLELNYSPTEKLGFHGRYVYSRANDISELNENGSV